MNEIYKNITEKVVDRFIQNILFVDDNAFLNDVSSNSFDSKAVSDIFAKKGKLCSFYAPEKESDIENYILLFSKADVIVLDWYINVEQYSNDFNDEEDAPVSDIRGAYTKKLINMIVDDASENKLKLIVVYTGEYDLENVTEEIYKVLEIKRSFKKEQFKIYSDNILILVRCKSQARYVSELKEMYVSYENLPNFILSEYAKFVDGLIPVFAILAIASIRENTSRILNVFSKDLDPAFMGHFISIPNSDDAFDMLPSIFGSAISELLSADFLETIDKNKWVDEWLDKNSVEKRVFTVNKKEISFEEKSIKEIVHCRSKCIEKKLSEKYVSEKKGESLSDKEKNKLPEYSTCLFCEFPKSDDSNYKFARIVQHRNLFLATKNHYLSLGSIISKDKEEYLLCIQQPCDSVRIPPNTSRKFLFLPLVKNNIGEPIVLENSTVLFVANKSYSPEIHSFTNKDKDRDSIFAFSTEDNSSFYFQDDDGIKYYWIADLKNSFAQKIVGEYSALLSRVGVDNSEWLRLKRKK